MCAQYSASCKLGWNFTDPGMIPKWHRGSRRTANNMLHACIFLYLRNAVLKPVKYCFFCVELTTSFFQFSLSTQCCLEASRVQVLQCRINYLLFLIFHIGINPNVEQSIKFEIAVTVPWQLSVSDYDGNAFSCHPNAPLRLELNLLLQNTTAQF